MTSLFKESVLLAFGLTVLLPSADAQDTRQLRFMSMSIRDRAPSIEDAKAYANGEKSLSTFRDEWLESEDHDLRVRRFFADLFAVPKFFYVADDAYFLEENADGVWWSRVKGGCSSSQAVTVSAWWVPSYQTIRACPNVVSQDFSVTENGQFFGCTWTDGFLRSGCGCGPHQILCYPKSVQASLGPQLAEELSSRAVAAYRQGLDWQQTFGGDQIFVNRPMYQFYLLTQHVHTTYTIPNAADILQLYSIPMDQQIWVPAPSSGAERAGMVTAPGFMRRFNNFRSRIRALTESLLCKDVGPSLNTHSIDHLVNPTHQALDLSISNRPQCSVCHLGMDNLGATIFGWNDLGSYSTWPIQFVQSGFAFGEEGIGPRFLMDAFLERGPGFSECMAKKIWEDFAGEGWVSLSEASKAEFIAAAEEGPEALISSVLRSDFMIKGRLDHATADHTNELNFANDINPILIQSCGASTCHGADSQMGANYQYVNNAERFRGAPPQRLKPGGGMPPKDSGVELSDDDRQKLIDFLSQ